MPGSPGDPAGLGRLPAIVVGTIVAVVTATGIGFTLSFLLRNQIAGVVGVVALSLAEQLLSAVTPDDLERYGPTASGTALVVEAWGERLLGRLVRAAGHKPGVPRAPARSSGALRAPRGSPIGVHVR